MNMNVSNLKRKNYFPRFQLVFIVRVRHGDKNIIQNKKVSFKYGDPVMCTE